MKIFRSSDPNLDTKNIKAIITSNSVDVTILRTESSNISITNILEKLGFPYLQADTLVKYSKSLIDFTPKPILNKDLIFSPATQNDCEVLANLVDLIFVGYKNHYSSNLYFSDREILEGYKEWVLSFINDQKKVCFIVRREGKEIAFAGVHLESDSSEGVLYGVHPAHSGGGIYTDLIRYTQQFSKSLGIKKMDVTTQIQNYSVQKVWTREGFNITNSYSTFHINSLLSFSDLPKHEFQIRFSEFDIENFGKVSKDFNPIHFDDNYAKNLGFNSRIVHGMTLNAIISKFYGTIFPGNGTTIISFKYIFFSPIYPNESYKMVVSFPLFLTDKSIYHSTVQLLDSNGNLCLVSYTVLINKIVKSANK